MFTLGPLAFLNPWMMLPLAGLPVLWWLLRLTPPAPRKINFPAIRLLMGITQQEETPQHTPWWLLLLRCVIVALILVGLAKPILNPSTQLATSGPLLLIVDDGWSAGPSWTRTQMQANALLSEAERNSRPVRLLFTAPRADGQPIALSDPMPAADARQQMAAHLPSPWPSDRAQSGEALEKLDASDVIYLSDGADAPETDKLYDRLRNLGEVLLYKPEGERLPLILEPPNNAGEGLEFIIRRAGALIETNTYIRAIASDGRLLAREEIKLPANQAAVHYILKLPAELRNAITRAELEGESSAGAVVLLDAHWRRRPVGIVAGSGADKPLIGEAFYLERALKPYADIRTADLDTLLTQGVSLLILADVGGLSAAQQEKLTDWIKKGGVLLRFAGPNLANSPDTLLPVKLRSGERDLNGTLSWSEPLSIRGFSPTGPLVGLSAPEDVKISREVLAEPAPDLASKSWATLTDGTPLITGTSMDKGWLVLVHTTANADWSNLPLSGLYVEILRRLLELGSGLADSQAAGTLLPIEVLGGLGQNLPPPPTAQPIMAEQLDKVVVSPQHPPGFYGAGGVRAALNLTASIKSIAPMPDPPTGIQLMNGEAGKTETPLLPWLVSAALVLIALDMLIVLRLRGLLAPALVLLLISVGAPAHAADSAQYATRLWLAYVVTGDAQVDAQSEAGLKGLRQVLTARTSVEPGGVTGVDLEQDDISLFPLLYWPVTARQDALSIAAQAKINSYLQHGGMIVFDTQDGQDSVGGNNDLMRLAKGIDLPPLAPIKPDHVLTRSFYLLHEFPGTFPVTSLWVDANPERRNDNVSGVIVGGGNWASAWAGDIGGTWQSNRNSQDEMARRFGVNLVMYALAGNYKSDQVHLKALLERIGQ